MKKWERRVIGFATNPGVVLERGEADAWKFTENELNQSWTTWEIEFVIDRKPGFIIFLKREITEPTAKPAGDEG